MNPTAYRDAKARFYRKIRRWSLAKLPWELQMALRCLEAMDLPSADDTPAYETTQMYAFCLQRVRPRHGESRRAQGLAGHPQPLAGLCTWSTLEVAGAEGLIELPA